jgi:hypothetical protein
MSAWRRALGVLLACVLLVLDVRGLCAQSSDEAARAASARALFQEGVQFAELGSWARAEDTFRRALSLRVSPVLSYNLASALAEQGKLVEAFDVLSRTSFEGVGADLQTAASSLRGKLSRRIGRVTVSVIGMQPEDRVLFDGRSLFSAQLGRAVAIDPGKHDVWLERAGQTLSQKSFVLGDGEQRVVELNGVALAVTDAAESRSPIQPVGSDTEDQASPAITSRWWFWTGAALLVVAGVGVGVAASSGGSARSEQPFRGNIPPGSVTLAVTP